MIRNVTTLLAVLPALLCAATRTRYIAPALPRCHLTFVRCAGAHATCRQLRPFQDRRSGFFLTWTA